MWLEIVAGICLAWYFFIVLVCSIGCVQLLKHYSSPPPKSVSSNLPKDETPHVTIIRPCKGLEPYLEDCLASAILQDYPKEKLTVYFCISSVDDPAFSTVQKMLNYKQVESASSPLDLKIFVEDEDPAMQENTRTSAAFGPNPKIRNMSRAYREAKGDIVWILDCNIWVSRGTCGRMVDKLCGFSPRGPVKPYKFVHHLPVGIDVDSYSILNKTPATSSLKGHNRSGRYGLPEILKIGGGRFEEVFLSSSHAKMYTAINSVAVAPCINGKSNAFRRSHLNFLTSPPSTSKLSSEDPSTSEPTTGHSVGIDHFSHNICEDHLIGDLLWRSKIPNEPSIGNHGLVFGDLALQPLADMSISSYIARRVRWLRVRKFTVTLATLVEPGTESFLCSAYGAFAVTTLPWFQKHLGIPSTWLSFFLLWLTSITLWSAVDWSCYLLLHSGRTLNTTAPLHPNHQGSDPQSPDQAKPVPPPFARPPSTLSRRPYHEWLLAWLGRESLALPIWTWAFWGGVTVVWRDRKFWVGTDMRVHEIFDRDENERSKRKASGNGHIPGAGVDGIKMD